MASQIKIDKKKKIYLMLFYSMIFGVGIPLVPTLSFSTTLVAGGTHSEHLSQATTLASFAKGLPSAWLQLVYVHVLNFA